MILRRTQVATAADPTSVAATAPAGDVMDRRVLRNELLVSLRRVALAGDAVGSSQTAT